MTKTTETPKKALPLFHAVLFEDSSREEPAVVEEDDEEARTHLLEEPLLSKKKSLQETSSSRRLVDKLLSFFVGAIVASLSQYLLYQTMWSDKVLTGNTASVIWFSVLWSTWTCGMVFCGMMAYLQMRQCYKKYDEDAIFETEAHFVVGSLLAVCTCWIVCDVLRLHVTFNARDVLAVCGLVVLGVAVVGKIAATHSPHDDLLMPTYHLLASCLGWIVGLCSQFLLNVALWRSPLQTHNVMVFSLLWSLFTVLGVFVGCMALRIFLAIGNHARETAKIYLRMEAHYIWFALCGICMAWILVDVVLDMPGQILPSLGMLGLALGAFCGILYCFPEDACLQEYEEEEALVETDDESEEQVDDTPTIAIV